VPGRGSSEYELHEPFAFKRYVGYSFSVRRTHSHDIRRTDLGGESFATGMRCKLEDGGGGGWVGGGLVATVVGYEWWKPENRDVDAPEDKD